MSIKKQSVTTLRQFYALMANTRAVRLGIVERYLEYGSVHSADVESLVNAAEALKAIPSDEDGASVDLDDKRKISLDLSYEISELEKDIIFLGDGEETFEEYLRELHPTLEMQVSLGVAMLAPIRLRNLITDRDGTVNNYCGRYLSSIQSAYNSVYIARFAQTRTNNAVILTSAPLEDGGLVDITTIPTGIVVNAGSKGREYRNLDFERGTYAIKLEKQAKLSELNIRLRKLLKEQRYEEFGLIGSGLQQKFGQTTVARQDMTGSVPEAESSHFLDVVRSVVSEVDPEAVYFEIEDTGLDVEIILTVPSDDPEEDRTDFDKGHGVGFLNKRLNLDLEAGPNLVCGDTDSDIPMLEECLRHSADTRSVFVTSDDELKHRVLALTERPLFVDEPDTLVSMLNALATMSVG